MSAVVLADRRFFLLIFSFASLCHLESLRFRVLRAIRLRVEGSVACLAWFRASEPKRLPVDRNFASLRTHVGFRALGRDREPRCAQVGRAVVYGGPETTLRLQFRV